MAMSQPEEDGIASLVLPKLAIRTTAVGSLLCSSEKEKRVSVPK